VRQSPFATASIIALLILAGLAAAGYAWVSHGLPAADVPPERLPAASLRFTDRRGRLLYEALPADGGRHQAVPLDHIPAALIQATVATEDRGFYTNPGLDLTGVLRAAWINLKGGETLAGGSTITQQVARNLLLDEHERSQRSLRRKLREGLLAFRLTRRYTKDEILSLYLNTTYYGGLAYGVEAAAQTYFGKPVGQLSLAESALLAGLPQAPGLYNPFSNPEQALERRAVVLGLMEKAGYLETGLLAQAAGEPLVLTGAPYPLEAPHFVLMTRAWVDRLLSPAEIARSGGLTVVTTLDLDAQRAAERAVANHLGRLAQQGARGLGHNVNNAALVAIDPRTGAILAMVGSPDYTDQAHHGAINMTLVPRQPGSALKPLIYAAAFDPTRAQPWTPATVVLDVRTSFVTRDGQSYTPANYDAQEHGPVSVRQALASSLNIPAVLALDEIGLPALFELSGRLGLSFAVSPGEADLSLALGGGEVSLLSLSAAYGAFASGGYRVDPYALVEIRDQSGALRYQHTPPPARRVLDERVAWLISDILSDDMARETGFGLNSVLNLDRPAAVKTGTTTNFHDNWTIGYTPDLVVGVWAGNASYQAMRDVNGLTGAGPIWHQATRAILGGQPASGFTRPAGLAAVEVCSLSGRLPTAECPYRRREWFIAGAQPTTPDTVYRAVRLDQATGRLADAATPPEQVVSALALDLPPRAQGWARRQGLLLWSDLLAAQGAPPGPAGEADSALLLANPPDLAVYRLAAGLPAESQRILLQAAVPPGLDNVIVWVDGQPLAHFDAPPYQAWWTLAPGQHEAHLTGLAGDGTAVESPPVRFEVLAD